MEKKKKKTKQSWKSLSEEIWTSRTLPVKGSKGQGNLQKLEEGGSLLC